MTVEQIIREAFEDLGEPQDLRPWVEEADGTVTDDLTILTRWYRWIDEGQKSVVGWKSLRRAARWRGLFGEAYFTALEKIATLTRASSGRNLYLAGSYTDGSPVGSNTIEGDFNKYRGYVVEIGSTQYLVEESYYDASGPYQVLVLDSAPVALVGATVTVRRRSYELQAVAAGVPAANQLVWNSNQPKYVALDGGPAEIVEVLDVETQQALPVTSRKNELGSVLISVGTPTEYRKGYLGISFDQAPKGTTQYRVTYKRFPRVPVSKTDTPELLEAFHYAIVIWCVWKGLNRAGEAKRAYAMMENFNTFMETHQNEFDLSAGLTPAQWSYTLEG